MEACTFVPLHTNTLPAIGASRAFTSDDTSNRTEVLIQTETSLAPSIDPGRNHELKQQTGDPGKRKFKNASGPSCGRLKDSMLFQS